MAGRVSSAIVRYDMGPIEKVVRTLVSLHRLQPLVNAQNTFTHWYILLLLLLLLSIRRVRARAFRRLCATGCEPYGRRLQHRTHTYTDDRSRVQGVFAGFDYIIIWTIIQLNSDCQILYDDPIEHRRQSVYDLCTPIPTYTAYYTNIMYNDDDNAIMWLQASAQHIPCVYIGIT